MPIRFFAGVLLTALLFFAPLPAQESVPGGTEVDSKRLTSDRIYRSDDLSEQAVRCRWLPEQAGEVQSYVVIEKDDQDRQALIRHLAATGERSSFVSSDDLVPAGRSEPLKVDDWASSTDLGRVLIFTNSVKVWRRNTRGDYWVLNRGSGRLQQVGGESPPQSLMYATFSPDGQKVAYVMDGDLYVQDLVGGEIRRVTHRENDRILNGMTDWVYEEEFGLRQAFHWSPDGKRIAYWHFDTSGVQDFSLINNTDSIYPTIKTFAYPKAGTRNSDVRMIVADLESGDATEVGMPGDAREHYLPRVQWIKQTGELLIRQMNRLQNRETLTLVNFDTGTKRVVLTERDAAWIDLQEEITVLPDAESFLYLSDRDGWRQLYRISVSESRATRLTTGGFDVVELLGLAPSQSSAGQDRKSNERLAYFIASPDSATERFLYSCSLEGGDVRRVTPDGIPGVHSYELSSDGAFAIHRSSTTETPTVTELISLPDHEVLRVLEDNQSAVDQFDQLDVAPVEFFKIKLDDISLDAWCMRPPNMEPGKRYPLVVYVYGEPAGSTVMNQWGGQSGLWHRSLTQDGYVVISIDNRGTDVPRGRAFRKAVYRRLATLGPDDQAIAIEKLLAERPELDPDRVGVWGWSGGGTSTLHAMFRYPDLYRTGVAVAPVANLAYYDTIYEERYMALPQTNVDGYRSGSAIHFADQLKGNLMLIHGTADDNVHYQATELLINELISKDKEFDMFLYPGRSHSINEGEHTRQHVMQNVRGYLHRHLPAGPK